MAQIQEITLNPPAQGAGATLVLTAATTNRIGPISAANAGYITLTLDAKTYMCRGGAATVPVVGVDQALLASNQYRVGPMVTGEYLCFISTPGGNVEYTYGS